MNTQRISPMLLNSHCSTALQSVLGLRRAVGLYGMLLLYWRERERYMVNTTNKVNILYGDTQQALVLHRINVHTHKALMDGGVACNLLIFCPNVFSLLEELCFTTLTERAGF